MKQKLLEALELAFKLGRLSAIYEGGFYAMDDNEKFNETNEEFERLKRTVDKCLV